MALAFAALAVAEAAPVSPQQARQLAQQFLTRKGRACQQQPAARHCPPSAAGEAPVPAYYVFNAAHQQGFVIVSGDDRLRPILGYSPTGAFSEQDMPDNMRGWLQGYADELAWMQRQGAMPVQGQAPVRETVEPMLATLWDQSDPYNRQCPQFLTGNSQCVTGCVATAMAQVLYYHATTSGRPTGTTKTIPAYECRTNWGGYGHVKVAAKPVTTFAWADMLASYAGKTGSAYDTQCQAVARLMAYCGASVQMNYADVANGGSSAYNSDIAPALKGYFGMEARHADRSDYTYRQWTALVYNELKAGRPVIYNGQSSGGGHSFVVDGYDGDELFHINWGWGGNSNGYFALSVCRAGDDSGIGASSSDDGYSYAQSALVGVEPSTGAAQEPAPQVSFASLAVNGNKIEGTAYNRTEQTCKFDIGYAYLDSDGGLSLMSIVVSDGELGPGKGYSLPATVRPGSKPAGAYKIVGVSRQSGTQQWLASNPDKYYVDALFSQDGSVTLAAHPATSLSVAGIGFPGSQRMDEKQPVSVTLRNDGDEFYGQLYLFASTSSASKGQAVTNTGVTLAKGATGTVQLSFQPDAMGTWHVWVATDSKGENVIGTASVLIKSGAYTFKDFMFSAMEIQNDDSDSWTTDATGHITGDVFSRNLAFAPTVKNCSGRTITSSGGLMFYFYLCRKSGSMWVDEGCFYGSASFTMLPVNQEIRFSEMTFKDLDYGTYRLELRVRDRATDTYTTEDDRYTVNMVNAYPVWTAQGDRRVVKVGQTDVVVPEEAVAVDLSNFAFTGVTPNGNSNTLYYLDSKQQAPAALAGLNVVQGGRAETVAIADGQPFFAPTAFTAGHISYTRTFSQGLADDGSGWSTIALPFAPTTVTAAGQPAVWQREGGAGSGSGARYWLMQYDSDDERQVFFRTADEFEAYCPYLVAVSPTGADGSQLAGQPVVFSAADAEVGAGHKASRTADSFRFLGIMERADRLDNVFVLNDRGSDFDHQDVAALQPFRAYFKAIEADSRELGLRFLTPGFNAIGGVAAGVSPAAGFFDLQGRRLTGTPTGKGLYIINGKKTLIR